MSFDIPADSIALEELAKLRQWVCFRMEKRGGNMTKIPVSPITGAPASTTASNTWSSFDDACSEVIQLKKSKLQLHGVGFVFTEGDQYVGIDLDKCIDGDGVLEDWAREIVTNMNSYTEFSPSGRGLHIFVKADIKGGGRRTGHLEVYSSARYFTFTGITFEEYDLPIRPAQEEMDALFLDKFSQKSAEKADVHVDAIDLNANPPLEKFTALTANNKKFKKTWDHARDDLKDQSMSGYDLSLATLAAYAGWQDSEIIALIVSHRRKYGDVKKAGRVDYIKRQLQVARSAVLGGSNDKEAQNMASIEAAKDSNAEDVLAEISSHLGVTVSGITKRGVEDNSTYYFTLDGLELLIGDAEVLFSIPKIRKRIFDATLEVVPSIKHEVWLKVCTLFKLVILNDADFHLTRPVETKEMLQDYLDEVTLYGSDEWRDAVPSNDPFEKKGKVWMRTKEILRYLSNSPSAGVKIAKGELEKRLRELGFKRENFTVREKSAGVICRTYWGVDRGQIIADVEWDEKEDAE